MKNFVLVSDLSKTNERVLCKVMKWKNIEINLKMNDPEIYYDKENGNFKIKILDDDNKEIFIIEFSEPSDIPGIGIGIELLRLNTLIDKYRNKGLAKYYMSLLVELCKSNAITTVSIFIGTDKHNHPGSEKIEMDKIRLKEFYKSFESNNLKIIVD
ncbi:hypothetical protein [Enterococcus casseliflavus]|uniref:N-acetyltransferase domain-containing protein n=1 Tax=Enterococcus casseliflavus TaxID=37734 RepID=A0ABD5FIE9_ENTCA|nr:hypothetical protein [Enterococcus casseliflavus]MDT2981870.1 hypothetical protein [Enterococcus casseliflavus]